ncbi:MAG: class I SAM-dependent methyltransferase [Sulfurovum sp.]|uniref:class I SAM-dependent methyltransferase n=1 Tax=Sulfurovum sp. TaxID=1969726 RepID=UPI0028680B1B|nr:class I SAM-dependent methyltransferase [Sulfurovum sp.]MCO4845476.1 class I SAM-dependent methyltransferase [Sulfurovum sp.]
MIPFNHLGWIFKHIGPSIYPRKIRESLCSFLIPLSKRALVLDLGAGTGIMTEFAYACREDLRFTAVDPAEGMLKFSAEYIETHKAHAETLPFEEDSFEAILIGEALHHFSDVDKSLQEIVRVLKEEGKLFIYEFDSSTFMGKSLSIAEKILGEPGNFFAPEVLKQILVSHGFAVDINQYGWRYTISGQLQSS